MFWGCPPTTVRTYQAVCSDCSGCSEFERAFGDDVAIVGLVMVSLASSIEPGSLGFCVALSGPRSAEQLAAADCIISIRQLPAPTGGSRSHSRGLLVMCPGVPPGFVIPRRGFRGGRRPQGALWEGVGVLGSTAMECRGEHAQRRSALRAWFAQPFDAT